MWSAAAKRKRSAASSSVRCEQLLDAVRRPVLDGSAVICLTKQELIELTGFRQRSAQMRWLREHGFKHDINGLGDPVVAVAEFNRHLVGGASDPSRQEPNFEALNETDARSKVRPIRR